MNLTSIRPDHQKRGFRETLAVFISANWRSTKRRISNVFVRLFGLDSSSSDSSGVEVTQVRSSTPVSSRSPRPPSITTSLGDLFERLDFITSVESSGDASEHGSVTGPMTRYSRRAGTYIDTASLWDFPDRVMYIEQLGLPAMISVGLAESFQIHRKKSSSTLTLTKINAVKIDRAPPRVEQARPDEEVYESRIVYASPAKVCRWGHVRKPHAKHGGLFFAVDRTSGRARLLLEDGKLPKLVHSICSLLLDENQDNTPEDLAEDYSKDFARAVNMFRGRDSNWLVQVEKRGKHLVRATFGVRPLDAPKIFNSRQKVSVPGKRTSPIYHPVRRHTRVTASGKETEVRLHHRGVQEFFWRGYQCRVVIPKKDAVMANDFFLPSVTAAQYPHTTFLSRTQVAEKCFYGIPHKGFRGDASEAEIDRLER